MKHAQFHQICLGKMDNKYGYEFKLSNFSNNKPERNVLLGKFNLWYDSYITRGTFKTYRTEARVNLRAFEAPLINFTTLGLKYSQKQQTASLAHSFNKSLSRSPNREKKSQSQKKYIPTSGKWLPPLHLETTKVWRSASTIRLRFSSSPHSKISTTTITRYSPKKEKLSQDQSQVHSLSLVTSDVDH